jgi:hypothetical protein
MINTAHITYASLIKNDHFVQTAGIVCKSANMVYAGIGLLKIASLSFDHPVNKYGTLPLLICIWSLGAVRTNQLIEKFIQRLTNKKVATTIAILPEYAPMSLPLPITAQKHPSLPSFIRGVNYVVDYLPRQLVITVSYGLKYTLVLAAIGITSLPSFLFLRHADEGFVGPFFSAVLFMAQFYPFFMSIVFIAQVISLIMDVIILAIREELDIIDKFTPALNKLHHQ